MVGFFVRECVLAVNLLMVMEVCMREYEIFYLVGETKEAELSRIRTEVETLIGERGGAFLPAETSDKRRLAYPIKGETRGFYIARRFTLPDKTTLVGEEFEKQNAEGDAIAAFTRKLSLSKDILRVLFLRADMLPELKPIERSEYNRKETRSGRPMRRERVTSDRDPNFIASAPPKPAAAPEAEKKVTKEEMDKQLSQVLDI